MLHTAVTIALAYALVGTTAWALLYASGVVGELHALRAARGQALTRAEALQAFAMVVLKWPSLFWALVNGFRRGRQ